MTHVYPINDEQEHDTESTTCHCNPTIDWENGIVIHNAFDCREIVEEAEKIKDETL